MIISVALLVASTSPHPATNNIHNTTNSIAVGHIFAGSASPLVYVNPSSEAVRTTGSTFSIQVKVANMPQFNGWDILVLYDPTVINATNVSVAGNDFSVNATSGSAFEIVNCVNGVGSGCTSSDRLGVAHSAFGDSAILTGNGLLFTVTFTVTGKNPSNWSLITLYQDNISDPNSGNGVPHSTGLATSYGTAPFGGGGGGGSRIME